jgi:EAL domain-containing protein (putative c-di-GMP-specific phosphodiesterase class I)
MCADVVKANAPLIVSDTAEHHRYAGRPSNIGGAQVRAYAGIPLVGRDGLPLGDFSVSDTGPRDFSERDLTVLAALADAAVALLERHRSELETGRSAVPSMPGGVEGTGVLDNAGFSAAGVRRALERGEIEVHFQPIVSIPEGRMTGLEALARWNLPGVGLISPEFFLPHVEASPLLSQAFTEHVLNSSCSQLAAWHALGAPDLRVSVNVSGFDVTGGMLPSMVSTAVTNADIAYDCLTIEITETVNLRDRDVAISHLGRIRDLGVRVTLDDFGVGYSSLEHAGLLPITGLKLDRSFVAGLGRSTAMGATLDSVVQLCEALEFDLVGEGVETAEVARLLAEAGVSLAQGYFFSRPVPFATISDLIRSARRALPAMSVPGVLV